MHLTMCSMRPRLASSEHTSSREEYLVMGTTLLERIESIIPPRRQLEPLSSMSGQH